MHTRINDKPCTISQESCKTMASFGTWIGPCAFINPLKNVAWKLTSEYDHGIAFERRKMHCSLLGVTHYYG